MTIATFQRYTIGESAYNLVQLNASAQLPAVDGSLLTNLIGAKVGQVVSTFSSAVQTGTTTIPADDTIPQNTEGTEFFTLSITPLNASSKLVFSGVLWLGTSSTNDHAFAIFKDNDADAIYAGRAYISSSSVNDAAVINWVTTANSTTARTYKIRAGGTGAATTTLNGWGSSRKFGGVLFSGFSITEILP